MAAKRTARELTSPEKKTKIPPVDRATWALLEEAFGARSGLRAGQMFGCPGFFLGTKAVAVTFGEHVTLTLPPARVEELVREPGYAPFIAGGGPMSGWVLIDTERFAALGTDAELFEEAIAYVRVKAARAKPAKVKGAAKKKARGKA